ncbi:MAG: NAD(P)-dependent oxidoreductase [Caldilineaceae bacterium]|nr:NAD(P)-dependent oxidoreductase [Caldilineaceae bacterium]
MRILLTGATGFIGRHLVEPLAAHHELYALVRHRPAVPHAAVHYLCQDLTQPLNQQQLPPRLDAIIHQAALIDTAGLDEAQPFLANVVGTWRLLAYAAAAGVHTFIHASTGGVYGCSPEPLTEQTPFNPMDLYSLTKAQAELAVQAACGEFHKVVLRYFFPYGVGTPNPIPSYVRRAVCGEPIDVLESGGPRLNPLHIHDAVTATVAALQLDQSITLNLAGREVTTFTEIAQMAAQQVGRQPLLQRIPVAAAIPYYQANLVAEAAHMHLLLPDGPQVSLATGIAELVTHARG